MEVLRVHRPRRAHLDRRGVPRRHGQPAGPGRRRGRSRAASRTRVRARDAAHRLGRRRRLASSWPRSRPTCASPTGWWWCRPGTEAAFLAPLPVRRLWGVGPKMEERLARRASTPSATSPRRDPATLERRFGTHGHDLLRLARGLDERPVVADPGEAKSVGARAHLRPGHATDVACAGRLLALCDAVARRLRSHRAAGAHGHAQVPRRDVPHPDPGPDAALAHRQRHGALRRRVAAVRGGSRPAQGSPPGRLRVGLRREPTGALRCADRPCRSREGRSGPQARPRGPHPRQLAAQPAVAHKRRGF